MNSEITPNTTVTPEEEGLNLDFFVLFRLLLARWYWIVASVCLFVGLGLAYLYMTPSVYERKTTLLIKDEGGGVVGFEDLLGMQGMGNADVEDEIQILSSQFVMREAVERLDAHIVYVDESGLRHCQVYETAPFYIQAQNTSLLMPGALEVVPLSMTEFQYTVREADLGDTIYAETAPAIARFGDTLSLYLGDIVLKANDVLLKGVIDDAFGVYIGSLSQTADNYSQLMQVAALNKMTSVIGLKLNHTQPRFAEDLLNTVVAVYNETTIADKNQIMDATERFIDDRLALVKQELDEVDGRIESYKRDNLATSAGAESNLYLSSAYDLEEKQAELDVQRSLIEILKEYMGKNASSRELLPYNIGLSNQALNSQIGTYNENLIRLNRLLAASSDRNPIVVELTSSLESLRRSISQTVNDMDHSLQVQQKELDVRTERNTGKIAEASTHEREVLSITRDQQIKSELYLYLLNKSEENAILRSTTDANTRILDRAYGSELPVSPNKILILLLMIIVGVGLPVAYFVIDDLFYAEVRGKSDVTSLVNLPILAELQAKDARYADDFFVVGNRHHNMLSETFRILRSNINFMLGHPHQGGVIAMTSTIPGEGKTYVSANLASTFGLTGKKVLLVGLDLRRPALQNHFRLRSNKGVSNYLSGDLTNILEAVVPSSDKDSSFDILPAGTIPPNPSELLMGERFDQMIAELRKKYDYIILDNPPAQVVADTRIINRVADMTLYVVRANYLTRRDLAHLKIAALEEQFKKLGVVVTDVNYERLQYSMSYSAYGDPVNAGAYKNYYNKMKTYVPEG